MRHQTTNAIAARAIPSRLRIVTGAGGLLFLLAFSIAGCPATEFYREGPGTASDRASGIAPEGSVGACKIRFSKRPALVNPVLWKNLKVCTEKTPRRYLRLGFFRKDNNKIDEVAERRAENILTAIQNASKEPDGNIRMLSMLRALKNEAADDKHLATRVERASSRTYPCDYRYLFTTMVKQTKEESNQSCSAFVYDPKLRREHCLFDNSIDGTSWLTGAWGCFAFTDTAGEGESCYRKCSYDDYCAAQTSCSAGDFDLIMCSMGICLPDKARGLY